MIIYTDKHKVPFQIDPEDYEAVSHYPWSIDPRGYVHTNIGKSPSSVSETLHCFLMGKAGEGLHWDHINRDKKDNRRSNLRRVVPVLNVRNTGLRATNKSGVKGVIERPYLKTKRFQAYLHVNYRRISLGYYSSLEEAGVARQRGEEKYW